MIDDSLEKRVKMFRSLSLPGQPLSMHMGTSYLVENLWSAVQQLQSELDAKNKFIEKAFVAHPNLDLDISYISDHEKEEQK